jgi:alpha-beta hydrolase superfamily lysophospholipase
MIYHSEGKFKGVGELDLYYQSWHPAGKIRGILVVVHGLGGHSGRYGNIVEHLLPQQYAIYGLDLRGHGQSPGQRGYINNWAEFRDDLQAFIKFVQQQQPGYPMFILGHSLGGVIVIDYTLRCPQDASSLQGVIVLAPSIGEIGVSPYRLLLAKLLSRAWPRFTLGTGLDAADGSRANDVCDPLQHTRGTARLATEFFATRAWIYAHVADWRSPLLILHGGGDRVALPAGSESFYQQVNYPDKLRIEYPGAYHEIQQDLNYPEVMADLGDWLERHLPIEAVKLESVMSSESSTAPPTRGWGL